MLELSSPALRRGSFELIDFAPRFYQYHRSFKPTMLVRILRPIDGPFGDFSDPDGYLAQARRAAVLGCEGKWAIHPSQIALASDVYAPTQEELANAEKILAAMAAAQADGKGAVTLDGRLIDIASVRQAETMVAKARRIAGGLHGQTGGKNATD